MKRGRRFNIAIVGAGKVGLSLGRILVDEGEKVVAVISRTRASARAGGKFLRCKNYATEVAAIPAGTDLIYLTVPHSVVEEVASSVAHLDGLRWKTVSACHASGMLTASALDPLARRGATVFSFHPLQTFPRDFRPRDIVPAARGIYYGVDGSRKGILAARRLARVLGGHILEVPPERRVLYHATCVLASNHLTAMMAVLDEMYRALRPGDEGFFAPFKAILMSTLRNIECTSPARALSGPVARGGIETVAGHFDAVQKYTPRVIPYYAQLTKETVRLASSKGSLTPDQIVGFKSLLDSVVRLPHSAKETS